MLCYNDDDQKYVSLKTDFYVLSPQECCLAHPLQPGCCRADRLSDNMITFIMMLHDDHHNFVDDERYHHNADCLSDNKLLFMRLIGLIMMMLIIIRIIGY